MKTPDFKKLSKKQLLEYFELERQQWLAIGMSEADIYRVHFGEKKEKGLGGDYREWLNERRHIRPDHKYAPGTPVGLSAADPDGALISSADNALDGVETKTDFERALNALTALQRYSVIEVCLKGRSYSDVARERGRHHSTIIEAVKKAKEKIKKYF